jgi:hypothetical protein
MTRLCSALLAVALAASPALGADPSAQIRRGEYVLLTHGCHDCHTPMHMGATGPEPDMTKMLSGHPEGVVLPPPPPLNEAWNNVGSATNTAFAGPWGITYSANLTPDPETGMGKWREKEFVAAMKTGKHLGVGRPILPPMPWPWFRHIADADLKAMFAYLRSVPPIRNRVPDWAPPGAR